MRKPAAEKNATDACGEALRDLLLIAASPDNLDAFLRRTMAILCRPDALGPGTGLAAVLRPGNDRPLFTTAVNFTQAEQRRFSALVRAGKKLPKDLLSAPIQDGAAKGRLLARAAKPAACSAQLLEIAAKTISGRLAQESREKQLTRERDIADAVTHLEELFLAFPAISMEEISRAVLDEARRLTGSGFGFAGYIDPATGWLHVPTLTDKVWKNRRLKAGDTIFREFKGLWGWVLKKRKPLISNSAAADPRAGSLPGGHIRVDRFAAAPAISGKELIGILALANPPEDYQPAALDAVKKLARVYALMLRHKLAERRQQTDDAKYKAILDTSSDVIYNMSVKGELVYVSRAAEIYGYAPGEIVGRHFAEFIHPTDRERVKKAFLAAVKAGRNLLPVLAYRLLNKDGTYSWVEQKNSFVPRPGAAPVITGVVRDITAYRNAEQQLAESEAKYRTIFEKANAAIFIADAVTGTILDANKDAEKLTGRTREELIGLDRLKLHPPAEAAHYKKQFREHTLKNAVSLEEAEILRKDGALAQVQISASRLTLDGREVIQGIFHDISARRQAEKLLQDIVDKNPMSIQIVDKDGFTLKVNAAHTRLFGAVPPPGFSIFNDPQLKQQGFEDLFGRVKKGEVAHFPDACYNAHDVSPDFPDVPVWVRTIIFPLTDNAGQPERFVLMHENITERKQIETWLLKSEERYRLLFDNMINPSFIYGMDGKILAVNKAACKVYGYTKSEFSEMTAADIELPEEATNIARSVAQLLRTSHLRFETRHRLKDGSIITVSAASQALDWEGRPATLTTCRDITGQKQVEAALRDSEETLRTIFETAKDAIFIKDLTGRYLKFNKAFADMSLLKPEAAVGRTDMEIFPAEAAREAVKNDREVIRTGKTVTLVHDSVRPSGRYYLNTVKTPLRDAAGKTVGVLGVTHDITGIKKMESELAAARASEALSNVARPMAHDFNNALAAINGYATMIDDELTAANPLKREISQIIKAVTRAAELTSKLQDFARNPKLGEQGTGKEER